MFGGTFSIMHWLVVLAVVLPLFGGRGKVSAIMGDFGKGLRNFKTGLKGEEGAATGDEAEEVEVIEAAPAPKKARPRRRRPRKRLLRKRRLLRRSPPKKKPPRKAK